MKTHTTLDLDRDLLASAAEALGTNRTTDTVHAALREAVARSARARLMARDWSNLNELLPEMRAPRRFLPQPGETAAAIAAAAGEAASIQVERHPERRRPQARGPKPLGSESRPLPEPGPRRAPA